MQAYGVTGVTSLAPRPVHAAAATPKDWESYAVRGDSATMIPSVAAIKGDGLVDALSTKRAVFLGEHHDAAADHALQAEVISRLRRKVGARPMAVGLEMVQRRFQPQLDLYTAGRLTEAELRKAVDWDKRWGWPFQTYVPVLKAAKRARAQLLALNADDEDAAPVSAGGLAALAPDARRRYVSDPKASEAFARTVAFKSYVGYTIRPSYAAHVALGILPATDPSACVGNDRCGIQILGAPTPSTRRWFPLQATTAPARRRSRTFSHGASSGTRPCPRPAPTGAATTRTVSAWRLWERTT